MFTMNDRLECSHCEKKSEPWARKKNDWQCRHCGSWSTQYTPAEAKDDQRS